MCSCCPTHNTYRYILCHANKDRRTSSLASVQCTEPGVSTICISCAVYNYSSSRLMSIESQWSVVVGIILWAYEHHKVALISFWYHCATLLFTKVVLKLFFLQLNQKCFTLYCIVIVMLIQFYINIVLIMIPTCFNNDQQNWCLRQSAIDIAPGLTGSVREYEITLESDSGHSATERVQSSSGCTERTCTHNFTPWIVTSSNYHISVAARNAVTLGQQQICTPKFLSEL